jgi:hypothetical protein
VALDKALKQNPNIEGRKAGSVRMDSSCFLAFLIFDPEASAALPSETYGDWPEWHKVKRKLKR